MTKNRVPNQDLLDEIYRDRRARAEESEEGFAPDAPHNIGLPSLSWRRPDKNSPTGLESLESNFKRFYMPGGREGPIKADIERRERSTSVNLTGKQIESLPEDRLRRNIEAIRAARELGYDMPKEVYDPSFLTALLIREGRSDLGGTDASPVQFQHNRKALELYKDLSERFGSKPAAIAALMYDKGKVSKRIKKPFPMVWNGIGVARDEQGRIVASGELYNKSFPAFIEAASKPENEQLFNFVNSYLSGPSYTSPLTASQKSKIENEYSKRQFEALNQVQDKLSKNKLRQLQYAIFGDTKFVGVPEEYSPKKAFENVPAPDFEKLTKQLRPEYRAGGMIENTTHDRKLI